MSENKTVIICASAHHGNTKKIVDAIAAKYPVDIIDITASKDADIAKYERVGIASGVAYGKYYPQMLDYLNTRLPEGTAVFFIHTAGDPREKHNSAAKAIAESRKCRVLGTFFCKGFDTFGPFKLVGGINKNRPDQNDIDAAIEFYRKNVAEAEVR